MAFLASLIARLQALDYFKALDSHRDTSHDSASSLDHKAGLGGGMPGITLDGIARRLQGVGQRTPRGGLRWSRPLVKRFHY
ncbi:hypothetical protein D3869_25140 (plasmid) [Azospirillum brasilense]|uniref:Uncharacterized protein n=1 Tax=Azospirillum brasilense TaxID=192 RepID=A0A4D8RCU4_AZOBR|nr:hypothetical protein D3869_25140 [Azospirillum brasilense]